MISNRIWYFVSAVLLVMCCGSCGQGEGESAAVPPPVESTEAPAVPYRVARCYSSVDGRQLTARLFFPENYDNAHQCPMVVVLPGTPFPDIPTLGQAIVAKLDAPRPLGCPDALLLLDYRIQVEYLINNYAVDPRSVFLAGASASDILFACLETPFFAGACFFFDKDLECDFNEMPLRNLKNIPVYMDNSAPLGACAGIQELERRLGGTLNPRLSVPKKILGVGGEDAVIASAFSWLAEHSVPTRDDIVWECVDAHHGDAWWFRVDTLANPAISSVVFARSQATAKGWRRVLLNTRNVRVLSIQTNSAEFPKGHPVLLNLDGMELGVTPGSGRLSFLRSEDGGWEAQNPRDGVSPEESSPAGLGALFRKTPLFVVGTDAPQPRAGLWMHSALDAAEAWRNATGISPMIKRDTEVDPQDLSKYSLVLFGSPADNHTTETLLEGNSAFLKGLFHVLSESDRVDDTLSAVTLCPTEVLSQDATVAMVLANGDDAIQDAWKPLLVNSAFHYDYIFRSQALQQQGKFSRNWETP